MATKQIIAKLHHYQFVPFYCKWKGGGEFDFVVTDGDTAPPVKEKLVELTSSDLSSWVETYRKPGFVKAVTKPNKTDLQDKIDTKEKKK